MLFFYHTNDMTYLGLRILPSSNILQAPSPPSLRQKSQPRRVAPPEDLRVVRQAVAMRHGVPIAAPVQAHCPADEDYGEGRNPDGENIQRGADG